MNELEKCMAGQWYNCHDDIFLEYKNNARDLPDICIAGKHRQWIFLT